MSWAFFMPVIYSINSNASKINPIKVGFIPTPLNKCTLSENLKAHNQGA
jgi:hypothetical protein